ncbi:HEAT repeat domain-containing protein [Limnofasciculus baicalensis]|uniref:HEAT repeat domain-containing protein n=1 Tax=Limnofasciculus baicalensis BBK-W-15 TaxID=2699891 RepID=A0AAE3KQU5_9CYAN|nr:HEAT repeat domain-containing protein [Limnofasciculus baicalensis]MCP2727742.1 HEAT repeat domain-containing protein [Limnofasciculus baicalensis BBK-W-15]
MLKLIDKIRKPLILFPLTLCLTLFLSLPWLSAQQPPKPKPQLWQIDGIVAALDDSYPQVKGYAFNKLVEYEAQDLKAVLKKPEDIAQKAVNILSDEKLDPYIRIRAALALGNLGEAGAKYVPDILNFLKDEKVNPDIRSFAAFALANLGEERDKLVLAISH